MEWAGCQWMTLTVSKWAHLNIERACAIASQLTEGEKTVQYNVVWEGAPEA